MREGVEQRGYWGAWGNEGYREDWGVPRAVWGGWYREGFVTMGQWGTGAPDQRGSGVTEGLWVPMRDGGVWGSHSPGPPRAAKGPAPHLRRSGGAATVKTMLLEWCRARTRGYAVSAG